MYRALVCVPYGLDAKYWEFGREFRTLEIYRNSKLPKVQQDLKQEEISKDFESCLGNTIIRFTQFTESKTLKRDPRIKRNNEMNEYNCVHPKVE